MAVALTAMLDPFYALLPIQAPSYILFSSVIFPPGNYVGNIAESEIFQYRKYYGLIKIHKNYVKLKLCFVLYHETYYLKMVSLIHPYIF